MQEIEIATGLSRDVPHSLRLVLMTNDGEGDDVVQVFLDGELIETNNSWENFYRHSPAASSDPTTRIVRAVLFHVQSREVGGAGGEGFLFNNVVTAAYDK